MSALQVAGDWHHRGAERVGWLRRRVHQLCRAGHRQGMGHRSRRARHRALDGSRSAWRSGRCSLAASPTRSAGGGRCWDARSVMALGMFMVPTTHGLVELVDLARHYGAWHRRHARGHQRRCGGVFERQTPRPERLVDVDRLSDWRRGRRHDRAAPARRAYDWRSVFYLGAIATSILIPIVFFFVPESVQWLTQKRPAGALERVNKTLRRLGHDASRVCPRWRPRPARFPSRTSSSRVSSTSRCWSRWRTSFTSRRSTSS